MLASTAVRAIAPKTASKTVLVGGGAYIAQTSISLHQTHRHYATAKKPANALPGAMTFTDALAVIKVLHQCFTCPLTSELAGSRQRRIRSDFIIYDKGETQELRTGLNAEQAREGRSDPAKEVAKPNHLVEVHIQTNTKAEKHSQPIRTSVLLQKPIKQESVILVFAEGKLAEEARASGANIVGGPELVKECISTPGMYPAVTRLARILGPKGLMPTTKKGTVTEDIAGVIKSQTAAFDIRGDKNGVVHTIIGKVNWDQKDIEGNYQIIMDQMKVLSAERFVKKDWIKNVYISSTQGPGIPLISNP
ncbi:hypothetical protein BGZ92_007624 [Podila epicladia]|nr:hypothetical protein BGZ92_007624 [Podila epicladia]